ncbi:hypothetical protein HOC35_05480 [Candidatus Woesearchaeota archaeon]|jgi:hypothetical protein|nr:hypothetical protein [Candidatus Woesearchaeota archaeon]
MSKLNYFRSNWTQLLTLTSFLITASSCGVGRELITEPGQKEPNGISIEDSIDLSSDSENEFEEIHEEETIDKCVDDYSAIKITTDYLGTSYINHYVYKITLDNEGNEPISFSWRIYNEDGEKLTGDPELITTINTENKVIIYAEIELLKCPTELVFEVGCKGSGISEVLYVTDCD